MRKSHLCLILVSAFLVGCQAGPGTAATVVTGEASLAVQRSPTPGMTHTPPTVMITLTNAASPTPQYQRWTVQQVLDVFKAAGLEVGQVRFNDPFDIFGAPAVAVEHVRFFTPSWGEDAGGLVFAFSAKSDMDAVYKYYKDAGWYDNGLYYPWVRTKDNILLQINGILSEPEAVKYLNALSDLK